MKASPLKYQKKSVRRIQQFNGRCLLAHEMGLGKTLIALWWWQRYASDRPALVVCPAMAKYVWEREAEQNLSIRPLILDGTIPRPSLFKKIEPKLVIVNYDVLQHWVPFLKRYGFGTTMVDECHYCKTPTAKRTKAVAQVMKASDHRIGISGTPITNRPIEMFPILQMIRPDIFQSRTAYAYEYCKPRWTPWGWKYDGACRIPDLHDLLTQLCMVRYLKRDVLKDLPDKTRRTLPIGLSDPGEYSEANDSFLDWIGSRKPHKLLKAKRAETLVKLGELKRLAAKLKLRATVDWINEWLEMYPGEKIVLFAVHRKMIQALSRRVEAQSVVVDGSVTGRKRQAAVDRFQNDPKTRVLIGNVQAAGVAITLTASSTVVFCELDWVPANMTQAEDRVHRIGQTDPVWIWWLVATGTIEEHLCDVLEKKHRVVTGILDGEKEGLDLNVHEQVLGNLLAGVKKRG